MRGHKELQLREETQLRFFSGFLGPGTIEKHIRGSKELGLEILFSGGRSPGTASRPQDRPK